MLIYCPVRDFQLLKQTCCHPTSIHGDVFLYWHTFQVVCTAWMLKLDPGLFAFIQLICIGAMVTHCLTPGRKRGSHWSATETKTQPDSSQLCTHRPSNGDFHEMCFINFISWQITAIFFTFFRQFLRVHPSILSNVQTFNRISWCDLKSHSIDTLFSFDFWFWNSRGTHVCLAVYCLTSHLIFEYSQHKVEEISFTHNEVWAAKYVTIKQVGNGHQ